MFARFSLSVAPHLALTYSAQLSFHAHPFCAVPNLASVVQDVPIRSLASNVKHIFPAPPPPLPPYRFPPGPALAADERNGKLVIVGGFDGGQELCDSHTFDAKTKTWCSSCASCEGNAATLPPRSVLGVSAHGCGPADKGMCAKRPVCLESLGLSLLGDNITCACARYVGLHCT